jgi:hypothetical protein
MKKALWLLVSALWLVASLLISGCGQDQSSRDDIAPSAPVWIPRSADDAYPQEGIRADTVSDDRQHRVRLEWYANPESDVAIYRIIRISEQDSNPNHHPPVKDLRLGNEIAFGQPRYSWVDASDYLSPDVSTGQSRGYFWEIQAIDTAGNKSPYSSRVYYRLIANPSGLSVAQDSSNLYTLSYQYTPNCNDDIPLQDVIRVYSQHWGTDSVVFFNTWHRYAEQASVLMDFHGSNAPLVRDCTYVCQVNVLCNRDNPSHAQPLAGAAAYTTFVYHQ